MAITIIRKNEVIKTENIIVTLYGQPGIGKTTCALTSKNPILFDFDKGMQRSMLRTDCIPVDSWQQLENLTDNDLVGYDTIVIDTVGRLLEVLALYLLKGNAKLGRGTGELTLQGYGALNTAFKAWLRKIKSYKKNIVLIGHAKESTKNDNIIVRVDAVGSSKDEIFKISDLMGYVESNNSKRLLNFNPTEVSLGKNCADHEVFTIPNPNVSPNFLAEVIDKTLEHMNALSAEQTESLNQMETFKTKLNKISSLTAINIVMFELKNDVDNSNIREMEGLLHSHATNLGFVFDKDKGAYAEKVVEVPETLPSDLVF